MTYFQRSIFTFAFLISIIGMTYGQDGVRFNSAEAQVGYILTPHNNSTYLIDQCGEIVNQWSISNPDFHVKLDKDGNVYYLKENRIIERDWEDNVILNIQHNIPELDLVYEVIKRSNGNYLVNCRWFITNTQLSDIGWNFNNGFANHVDGIVEINPQGDVVWAWNIIDHTIQESEPNASNFGIVDENPQLLDSRAISTFDWNFGETFMFNGFDYNEELDLILISVRKMSEVIIIDHSTTTEEAAGHTGGKYGKGGDILFRWGNPANYNSDTQAQRQLYFQHNPNWIEYGEYKGGIIIFNNGLSTNLGSSVVIIEPEVDEDGNFIMINDEFSPSEPVKEVFAASNNFNSSQYTSGAKVQENGNIYITIGQWDEFIEINTEDEIVWEYGLQGNHYTYRTEKYPNDYPGLEGKDLTPNGTIELFPSGYDCDLFTSTEEINLLDFTVHQNQNQILIRPHSNDSYRVLILDVSGRTIMSQPSKNGIQRFDINGLSNQVIFINIINEDGHMITEKLYVR